LNLLQSLTYLQALHAPYYELFAAVAMRNQVAAAAAAGAEGKYSG
jgi:hypothetical protein